MLWETCCVQHTFISMPKATKECLIFCPNVTAVKWAILIWCNNLHTRQTRRCYLPFLKRKEFLFCRATEAAQIISFFFFGQRKGPPFCPVISGNGKEKLIATPNERTKELIRSGKQLQITSNTTNCITTVLLPNVLLQYYYQMYYYSITTKCITAKHFVLLEALLANALYY